MNHFFLTVSLAAGALSAAVIACDPEIADELTPQEFPTFIREGFAVLEWGGIRID